jgi:GTPase Era involved in 16S rRNA processing
VKRKRNYYRPQGAALKKVGVDARADLEKFFGKQIHIELYVKVNKIEKQRKHVKAFWLQPIANGLVILSV